MFTVRFFRGVFFQGGMHGFFGGACVVFLGVHGFLGGGFFRGACVVFSGGHAWFFGGAYVVFLGGCALFFGGAWLFQGGMHGFFGGACVVFLGGGVVLGGMRGFSECIGYNKIRSMSGWYASYWNAFLFFSCLIRLIRREL